MPDTVKLLTIPFIPASGQKLTVGIKRPAHLGVMNKSQTLPRSMGSKAITNGAGTHRQTPKPAATPPAIRRQFSVTYQFCF